ncbi:hypothetical protein NUACC21_63720 [Scytonema sp. NUACC21]
MDTTYRKKTNFSEKIQLLIKVIVESIIGDTTKLGFQNFVARSWKRGELLYHVDERYHSNLCLLNSLEKDNSFQTVPFYLPHQVFSTSTLLYNHDFAARLVHDYPDGRREDAKFSEYNIEPHYHSVDSIIIVTSQEKSRRGRYFIHDTKLGFDTMIEILLSFGSVVCFPRYVNHTLQPSDIGLSTLNITDTYIEPQRIGFSYPSTYNFDEASVLSYADYQTALHHISINK